MADFVAVLRKTIGALAENTPAMREKVFDKARAAIEAKLAALQPPPPLAVADRQRKALEDAIVLVRAEYAQPADSVPAEDDLEEIFASLSSPKPSRPAAPPPAPTPPPPARSEPNAPAPEPFGFDPPRRGDAGAIQTAPVPEAGGAGAGPGEPLAPQPVPAPVRRRRGARRATALAAAVVLVLLAGGAYAVWLNRDDVSAMLGYGTQPQAAEVAPSADDAVLPASDAQAGTVEEAAEPVAEDVDEEPVIEHAAATAAPSAVTQEAAARSAAPEKFTQRLLPDGSEVDPGPAGGERRIGEGSSVASAAPPTAGSQTGQVAEAQPQQTAQVAVGQRAIFYEERTSSADGSAEIGSIVWSVVRESPGGDEPPEPAIRAEATIPAHNLQLRMTIRRNADRTLPASHIIEMIFLTPDNFGGGAIDNVLRVAMKDTEQAAGVPLMGIPAKIADGFFLVALSDSPAEMTANLNIMSRQSWIDVPVIYSSGRRALMTMEKGLPGERVFNEAIRAWREASSSG